MSLISDGQYDDDEPLALLAVVSVATDEEEGTGAVQLELCVAVSVLINRILDVALVVILSVHHQH